MEIGDAQEPNVADFLLILAIYTKLVNHNLVLSTCMAIRTPVVNTTAIRGIFYWIGYVE